MRELCLIRHGESRDGNLTPKGMEQVRLACERWMREGESGEVAVFHSPTKRAKDSAVIVSEEIGIPSIECMELAIGNFHNNEAHRAFASMLAHRPESLVVLVGHDETRRVCEAIVFECFGRRDESSELPLGGILCFTEEKGFHQIE